MDIMSICTGMNGLLKIDILTICMKNGYNDDFFRSSENPYNIETW